MIPKMLVVFLFGLCFVPEADAYDSFVWLSADVSGVTYNKAVILVPVKFQGNNRKLYAQLDTGSDATILYGNLLRKYGIAVDSTASNAPAFRWYGHDGATGPLEKAGYIDWSMDSDIDSGSADLSRQSIGTIGLDKVVGKILILDFQKNRYEVLTDTLALRGAIPESVDYCDAEISYNKFYVNVQMGPDTIFGVRYDCGASISTLILPLDWWQWATGLKGDEPQVVKDSIVSWGNLIEEWRAPARYELTFGKMRIKSPMVTYVGWADPTLTNAKLLGNALFYDDYVLIIDCIRSKLGVGRWK
jgi:hypothetical protein